MLGVRNSHFNCAGRLLVLGLRSTARRKGSEERCYCARERKRLQSKYQHGRGLPRKIRTAWLMLAIEFRQRNERKERFKPSFEPLRSFAASV
jgi:hypothetical protein